MSNDEIERRLCDLEPAPPRESVRASVLDAVQTELDAPAGNRLDRFLARRAPWAAAAALLLVLLGANLLLQRDAASKSAARRAAIESDARSMVEFHAWLAQRASGGLR